MSEEEYRPVLCQCCGQPLKDEPERVVRVSPEDKKRWKRLNVWIPHLYGWWSWFGALVVGFVAGIIQLPLKVLGPIPTYAKLIANEYYELLAHVAGKEILSDPTLRVILWLGTVVGLYFVISAILVTRYAVNLKRERRELLAKYGYQEKKGERFAIEEAKTSG